MKNAIKVLGIIAIAAIIGFSVMACSDGGSGKDDDDTTGDLTITGQFPSQGGGSVSFLANQPLANQPSVRSIARTISHNDFVLEGHLKDGDTIFLVKGYYDSTSKTYSLSASSAELRYNIFGEYNNSGTADTGKAVVQDSTNGYWTTQANNVIITQNAPTINTGGEILDDSENGFPTGMRGNWSHVYGAEFGRYMITPYSFVWLYPDENGTWVIDEGAMFFTDITVEGDGLISGIYTEGSTYVKFGFKLENGQLKYGKYDQAEIWDAEDYDVVSGLTEVELSEILSR